MRSRLETGFLLDRLYHRMMGSAERSKRSALVLLARTLEAAAVDYAIIGGVALQLHSSDPRTTLDIDVAVHDRSGVPRDLLEAAGFTRTGDFPHSQNWSGPESVPVQFTDDPLLGPAIQRAVRIAVEDITLRVIGRTDLLHEKLRSGADPGRRRSKRLQDLADAHALLEADPSLAAGLSPAERALLDRFAI